MKKIILLLMLQLCGLLTFAQTNKLAGSWTLSQRNSISGPDYINGVPSKLSLKITKDSVTIIRTTAYSSAPETTISETLAPNGKVQTRSGKVSKRQKIATLTWEDQTLREHATISMPEHFDDHDFETTDEFSLSADGNILTLTRKFSSFKNPAEKWEMRGLYNKN